MPIPPPSEPGDCCCCRRCSAKVDGGGGGGGSEEGAVALRAEALRENDMRKWTGAGGVPALVDLRRLGRPSTFRALPSGDAGIPSSTSCGIDTVIVFSITIKMMMTVHV